MSIHIGESIPEVTLTQMQEGKPGNITTGALLSGKKVVLFALPGAFTPTCSSAHLPGYLVKSDELFAAGVDSIVCLSVNDAFVMGAWGQQQNVEDRILMIADGNADLTRALGLEVDLSARGMGVRSQRYAMIINDGKVEALNVEAPGQFEVSDAESMLKLL